MIHRSPWYIPRRVQKRDHGYVGVTYAETLPKCNVKSLNLQPAPSWRPKDRDKSVLHKDIHEGHSHPHFPLTIHLASDLPLPFEFLLTLGRKVHIC